MTQAQFDREKNYRVSISIAKYMLREGVINEKEFSKIDKILIAKYNPVVGGL